MMTDMILYDLQGRTRQYSFFLDLLGHSLLEPSHHARKKPKKPTEKNQDSKAPPTCPLRVICKVAPLSTAEPPVCGTDMSCPHWALSNLQIHEQRDKRYLKPVCFGSFPCSS